jgi:hypothetical protein
LKRVTGFPIPPVTIQITPPITRRNKEFYMSKKNKNLTVEQLKNFSQNLNDVFRMLNDFTGKDVFISSVDEEFGELNISICGRDSHFNQELELVGSGMWLDNPYIPAIKNIPVEK